MSEKSFIDVLENKLIGFDPDLQHLTAEEQLKRIMSKVADIPESVVSPEDLLERLKKSKEVGKPLTVKFGIDPTGPDIHIGHAVPLINLRLLQRMGHKILLIIGDFTGMIGDPSGRMDDRPALTEQEMEANMATYEDQAARIIDLRDPSIERHYNSKWMNKITLREWVNVIKKVSASALLQREDFRERLAGGHGLSLAEMEYALFMGYDSVVLEPDLEIGGMDQYLNMHVCRDMMANAGQKPEIIVTYNLLAGTTGEQDEQGRYIKMSKSRGNYIPVTAEPADMYGKVMSIPDEIMWIWYRELTEITADDLKSLKASVEQGGIHPKEAKQLLARVIVGTFNSFDSKIIQSAEEDFNAKFGKKAVLIPDSAIKLLYDPKPKIPVTDTSARSTISSQDILDNQLLRENGRNTSVTDTTPATPGNKRNYQETQVNELPPYTNDIKTSVINQTPENTINPQDTCVTSLSNISGRSKSDIRRLVQQKGVRILEEGKQEYGLLKSEELNKQSSLFAKKKVQAIRIGKRDYYKIIYKIKKEE